MGTVELLVKDGNDCLSVMATVVIALCRKVEVIWGKAQVHTLIVK